MRRALLLRSEIWCGTASFGSRAHSLPPASSEHWCCPFAFGFEPPLRNALKQPIRREHGSTVPPIAPRETATTDIRLITDPVPSAGSDALRQSEPDEDLPPLRASRLRLGYRKSRTGCLRCKARRVKCDESRPCGACVRHGIECSLATNPSQHGSDAGEPLETTTASSYSAVRTSINTQEPSQPRPLLPRAPTQGFGLLREGVDHGAQVAPNETDQSASGSSTPGSDRFLSFAKLIHHQGSESLTISWVSDLELLHHFTTSTYQSLPRAREPAMALVWQVDVPKLAFSHLFLLHQILATAAFHLSRLRPDMRQEYSMMASHHLDIAVQGMRVHLRDLNTDNCHAVFAASYFLPICGLGALARPDAPAGPTLETLVEVFILLKGAGSILHLTEIVRHGPLSPFFVPAGPYELKPGERCVLERFRLLAGQMARAGLESDVEETASAEIRSLVHWIEQGSRRSSNTELRIALAWPTTISDAYLALLRQRNAAALAVLAYYCSVLFLTEKDFWFTRGWAIGVLKDISSSVTAPWYEAVQWSLDFISSQE